jgi:hypothetical protein
MIVVALIATVAALLLLASPAAAHYSQISGTVTGQLPGGKSEPLAEVKVTFLLSSTGEVVASGFTDGNGKYELSVPAGLCNVEFDPPTEAFQSTTLKEIHTDEPQQINLVLSPSETVHLTGTLLDAAGEPVGEAYVELGNEAGGAASRTDAEGRFDVAVVAGEYELFAHGGDFNDHWEFLGKGSVAMGSSREIDLQLPVRHRLAVEVLGAGGTPLAGAEVWPPSYEATGVALAEGVKGVLRSGGHATTGKDGVAELRLFGGTPQNEQGSVRPPAESGYGEARFPAPTLEGDTTVVVNLGGKAEEEDTTAPRLEELSFEPEEVDVSASGQTVYSGAHIVDEGSGLAKGTVSFASPSGEVFEWSTSSFQRTSGTAQDGEYMAKVPFFQGAEAGTWTATVVLVDNAGNERTLTPGELEELGFPAGVQVTSKPPVVAEISPAAGPEGGGTAVTISGSGLAGAEAVSFGAAPAAEFSVKSASSIVAITPPGTGTVDVTVTTPSGTSATSSADRFSYSPQVSLSSSPNPSTRGQKVTFVASVTPAVAEAPMPQGTVAFVEGTSTLGVANLTSKGTATLNTTKLGAGTHKVVAEYSGDSYYGDGESEAVLQEVIKATTRLSLSSTLNPSPYGATGTVRATVEAVSPGAGTPAGTVTFSEGETVLATVQMSGSAANLQLKSLSLGVHEITATYSGDHDYLPSEAEAFTQTVVDSATEINLYSTLNPAPFGSSGSIKATVNAVAPGGGTPSGTVTFTEGETVLASVPLAGHTATLALKSLTPGIHDILATYSGATGYLESEAEFEEEITAARTDLTLTTTLNPAPFGSSGTLKATVDARAPGGGTPGGSVTFREGETTLATVPLSGPVAKLPLKEFEPGEHVITAIYSGNADYEPSEDTLAQTITKASTRLTLTSSKNPAPLGSAGNIKATLATIAPGGGHGTGTVTFAEGPIVLATVPISGTTATYPLSSLPEGTHEITATYNGSADYETSSDSITQVISP